MPWSLVFVSASFLALAALALLPQPKVVGTDSAHVRGVFPPLPPSEVLSPVDLDPPERVEVVQDMQILLHVVDQVGADISQVKISCDRLTDFAIGRILDGYSDDHGLFCSGELVAGEYQVQLSHADFLAVPNIDLKLPEAASVVKEIRMKRGCLVRGQLFGGDGIPRNHGTLALKQYDEEQVYEVKPDAQGSFRFPAVNEGAWELSWYTNQQFPKDPRLVCKIKCKTGQDSNFQIIIPTPDLRAITSGEMMEVGIQELLHHDAASQVSEL